MNTTPHPESTAATLQALVDNLTTELKVDPATTRGRKIAQALQDAFDLGKLSPTAVNPVAAAATPVRPGDRAGMVATVVHTIKAETIAEHGPERAMLAFIQQSARELAAHGARPDKGSVYEVVGMMDGTIVVTAEGVVGA